MKEETKVFLHDIEAVYHFGTGAQRVVHRSHSSMSASLRKDPKSPPSSSLTHIPFSVSYHAAAPPLLTVVTHLGFAAVYL